MTKRLLTLEEHNAAISECVHDYSVNLPMKNGIACPKCGKELYDSAPAMLLASNPPKKSVHCGACGYRGMRLA